MRTYCMAQGTLLNTLWWPKREGKIFFKREYMCTHETEVDVFLGIPLLSPWSSEC